MDRYYVSEFKKTWRVPNMLEDFTCRINSKRCTVMHQLHQKCNKRRGSDTRHVTRRIQQKHTRRRRRETWVRRLPMIHVACTVITRALCARHDKLWSQLFPLSNRISKKNSSMFDHRDYIDETDLFRNESSDIHRTVIIACLQLEPFEYHRAVLCPILLCERSQRKNNSWP